MRTSTMLLALLLVATPMYAQEVIELAPGDSIEAAIPVTIRALADTVFIGDTIFVTDTLTVTQVDTVTVTQVDTVFVGDTVPVDTVYVPVERPGAPDMFVAGYAHTIPSATEHGLYVEWAPMKVDSFRVTGGKQDGTDPFAVILPGTDTIHRQRLFYDTVTAMRGCVSALRFDLEGPAACDNFDWAPMAEPGEPPAAPGTPFFTLREDGTVRVEWPEADRATSYTYWYTGHPESQGLTTPTNSVVLDDFSGGGYFCVRGVNAAGPAPGSTYRCNSWRPPEAELPTDPDLSLVVLSRLQHEENETRLDELWDVTNEYLTDWNEKAGIVGNDCTKCRGPWMHPGHGYRFVIGSWDYHAPRPVQVAAADSARIRVNGQVFSGAGPLPLGDEDWRVPRADSVVVEWTAWPGPQSGRWSTPVRCYGGPPWTIEERGSSC